MYLLYQRPGFTLTHDTDKCKVLIQKKLKVYVLNSKSCLLSYSGSYAT